MGKLIFCFFIFFPIFLTSQIVINELDADSPGVDNKEFIELKSVTPFFSLNGYVLVLFNGSPTSSTANKSYFTLDLDGYTTDFNGIITIGSVLVSPVPQILISEAIIQNGEDAVAIYTGNASDFPLNTLATTNNLIDALVYDTSDPDALDLMALLGETNQWDENINMQGTTESIQRMDNGLYEVKLPTPGANNDGSGLQYNGLSIAVSQSVINEGAILQITFSAQNTVNNEVQFFFSVDNDTFNTSDIIGPLVVSIPQGSSSATVSLTLVDDTIDEGDELMIIRFGAIPPNYNRLNDAVEVRVIDNDFTAALYGTPLSPTYGLVSGTVPSGYYATLEGKSGTALQQTLQDIIADPSVVREHTYGDVELILKQADQNPTNSNEVWLMYVEQGRAKYKFQTSSSSTGFWNREHIFPQSRGGFSDATSPFADGILLWDATDANDIAAGHSDAHALRAEDGPENISRSNRDYGTDYNGPSGNQGSWKGDVARALFYMAIRYNGLSLINGNPPDSVVGQMADLASLLTWNQADPPDDFEMNRNNVVQTWQQNRNPFIDYPLLADYIWGANAGDPWSFSLSTEEVNSPRISLYPNPARESIAVSGTSGAGFLTIYNISGKKVLEAPFEMGENIAIDLPSGFYLAKVAFANAHCFKKLIVR